MVDVYIDCLSVAKGHATNLSQEFGLDTPGGLVFLFLAAPAKAVNLVNEDYLSTEKIVQHVIGISCAQGLRSKKAIPLCDFERAHG